MRKNIHCESLWEIKVDYMLGGLVHNYTVINFKIQLAVGDIFFPSLSTCWCDPPHTFLIISVGDSLGCH